MARPTVMTTETINKLEEVFAIGGTDQEACFYADISHQTLYDYQKKFPAFIERKEALKERPVLKARQTIAKSLDNPDTAKWYLERKKKNEFSSRIENTGADGKDLIPQPILGNLNVISANLGYEKDSPALETNQGDSGRDISEQDDLNTAAVDTGSPDGQETETNLNS